MATTMFFERDLTDAADLQADTLPLEFGRSSFLHGESRVYIRAGDKALILEEDAEKEFFEAMHSLGVYLGYY